MIPTNATLLRETIETFTQSGVKGSKAFGFYWTRKNSSFATALIKNFGPSECIVLDPFLGSGTTILGAIEAPNCSLAVGIELNQLPIENLRVTLGTESHLASSIPAIRKSLEKLRMLYTFKLKNGTFTISKIIHDLQHGALTPRSFLGDLDGVKTTLSESNDPQAFQEALNYYFKKIEQFGLKADLALQSNSRIAVKPGMSVSDVFGPIGFEALSQLKLDGNGDKAYSLTIGASLHLCRLTDSKSQSQFPYWYPKQEIHEKSVVDVVTKQLNVFDKMVVSGSGQIQSKVFNDFQEWKNSGSSGVLIIQGDTSMALESQIPEKSVDLVITDPPYFDQVAYSEYLKLWEHFTGFESNLEDEIVESSRLGAGKSRQVFLNDLRRAFVQVRKAMKDGALALIYFKDSKPRNLHDFIFCVESAGFKYETQSHFSKPTYTYKQNTSQENTVGGDAVLVFQASDSERFFEPKPDPSIRELDEMFIELFSQYVREFGPSTLTEALDNKLIKELYPTGYLGIINSSKHFSDLAKTTFTYDSNSRKWSLKNE